MKLNREQLEQIFCWILSLELHAFRYSILEKEKEEIYSAAYRIDCMINLYELLVEKSRTMKEEMLVSAILFPNLLGFLYDRWLGYGDSHMEELQDCIGKELAAFENSSMEERKEKTA